MASTYSPALRLELIGTGDQSGVWGDTTNTNLGSLLEQAITGVESIPMTDTDYTLSSLNGSADEARNAVIIMTSIGSLTANRNVIIPSENKVFFFKNGTTGGFSLIVKTSSGSGYTVPNGQTCAIYCDGTDCFSSVDYVSDATFADATLSNAALTGTPTAPTASYGTSTTQVATTAFVQAALQAVYPVGSVYINAAVSTNPATLLGFGTWTVIGTGRVLVGLDASDALFDTLGETGGSKDAINVSHTHTASSVSVVTDPGHSHSWGAQLVAPTGGPYLPTPTGPTQIPTTTSTTGITVATTTTVASAGSSGTNANVQPYVVVQMWKRTA